MESEAMDDSPQRLLAYLVPAPVVDGPDGAAEVLSRAVPVESR